MFILFIIYLLKKLIKKLKGVKYLKTNYFDYTWTLHFGEKNELGSKTLGKRSWEKYIIIFDTECFCLRLLLLKDARMKVFIVPNIRCRVKISM